MPPRRSTRKATAKAIDNGPPSEPEVSGGYFEIGLEDLAQNGSGADGIEPAVTSSDAAIEISSDDDAAGRFTLSRKLRLQLRKTHLIAFMCSLKYFIDAFFFRESEIAALAVSILPPHILRIFDPVSLSSPAGQKSLKNCVGMLATWWKNNIGMRMLSGTDADVREGKVFSFKTAQLKAALLHKNAYEDDFVKLFALILFSLGVKVRLVHSLQLISASAAASKTKQQPSSSSSFKYIPTWWTEVYSSFEERWIAVDCIQGVVEERARLESKSHVHSFVLAIDSDKRIHDLTYKYASDYEGRTFRLRKDEDKWLGGKIQIINAGTCGNLSELFDRESQSLNSDNTSTVIEIPRTLSAIKNHPLLMLASQLKKYEVFYPIQEPVGFFKDEPVYLRAAVQKVRSKDAWLSQFARVVRDGEGPVKLVNLPRKAGAPQSEPTGVQPLYGEWQTDPYKPPVVIDGKIPRNEHGNVDLFQPSMLPEGCVHVSLPGAWKVAKHLGIDYADACIGFSFHGGRAAPSIHGIVITEESYPAFESKYKATLLESLQQDANELEHSIAQKWVKLIKNTLIARRLKQDSSVSFSESLISVDEGGPASLASYSIGDHQADDSGTISAFSKSPIVESEGEIDAFDAI